MWNHLFIIEAHRLISFNRRVGQCVISICQWINVMFIYISYVNMIYLLSLLISHFLHIQIFSQNVECIWLFGFIWMLLLNIFFLNCSLNRIKNTPALARRSQWTILGSNDSSHWQIFWCFFFTPTTPRPLFFPALLTFLTKFAHHCDNFFHMTCALFVILVWTGVTGIG